MHGPFKQYFNGVVDCLAHIFKKLLTCTMYIQEAYCRIGVIFFLVKPIFIGYLMYYNEGIKELGFKMEQQGKEIENSDKNTFAYLL